VISIEPISSSANARVLKIKAGVKQLSTPTYFPAISRPRMTLPSEQVFITLVSAKYPRLLVSAYDFHEMQPLTRTKTIGEISDFFRNGSIVMLDSGIFESYWSRDNSWTFKEYAKWVKRVDSDFYFSYDLLANVTFSEKKFLAKTISQINRSRSIDETSYCVPIVHGLHIKQILSVIRKVASIDDGLRMLAVSERDCGQTLSERANTILEIRKTLTENSLNSVLHVLGCGNPVSMAVYCYCGADTFDSLDWTQMVIERNELRLANLSQLELLNCTCKACLREIRVPLVKALLHNLRFYQDYVMKLQAMIKRGTLRDFLVAFVGHDFINIIDKHESGG
jgi:queuine/archaeosine tRNA-ribosyltransferase